MNKMNDTKQHILTQGYQLIAQKGFSAVGLAQILKAAGVPKGSFYHYFSSKEQFGQSLIEYYFAQYMEQVDALFEDQTSTALQRLMHYWQSWTQCHCSAENTQKCLVVKLSAEVADLSDAMREALLQGAKKIVAKIAEQIELGQQDGSISKIDDAYLCAETLYFLWLGASLMSKLQLSAEPLNVALTKTEKLLIP